MRLMQSTWTSYVRSRGATDMTSRSAWCTWTRGGSFVPASSPERRAVSSSPPAGIGRLTKTTSDPNYRRRGSLVENFSDSHTANSTLTVCVPHGSSIRRFCRSQTSLESSPTRSSSEIHRENSIGERPNDMLFRYACTRLVVQRDSTRLWRSANRSQNSRR